ncbi:DNA-binding protein [Escherichia coli]|nr:DNA-binding protein [Escherichia coli]
MAKVLNTHEQADFERLAAFYPYRDEHGLNGPLNYWNSAGCND